MREAVILAAGDGVRLGRNLPKALTPVAGRPLLGWITSALAEVGVRTVHIIVGSGRHHFERVKGDLPTGLEVRFSQCPDWQLGNGRSAAHAEGLVTNERFLLMMSDHLVSAEHLRRVITARPEISVLGTSALAPWIDVDDATKVTVDASGLITDIGKDLSDFNAIDTGVFAFTRAIFPALEEARRCGEYSLTAGNRRLCRQGGLRAAPIGDLRWQDIDTPADLAAAEQWLTNVAAS